VDGRIPKSSNLDSGFLAKRQSSASIRRPKGSGFPIKKDRLGSNLFDELRQFLESTSLPDY
jgi:hypothetical protein